jgi:cyanophycinase
VLELERIVKLNVEGWMIKDRHLFLFGGSPPFGENLGKKFADNSLNDKGKVAVLFIERDGWEEYMHKYTNVLVENEVTNFVYLPLSPDINTLNGLISCTGIIIGGGETELYRKYIVDTEIGFHIKKRYEEGVPVAGFSAGALISPENCIIPLIDNVDGKHLFLTGLGLIKDCIISVHFSKWNGEENLKKALIKAEVSIGYGIDDGEGLYFKNDVLSETEGGNFYIFKE